jgi:Lon protease-like protein
MSDTLPMFPLNTVLFPGMSVPLRVFEDRYRALVHHLLRVEDPTERVFGSVGIREGYEVGEHGAQWLFRIGCRLKMTEVEPHPDGTFELVAVGLDRIELEHLDTSGTYPVGRVAPLTEHDATVPDDVVETARAMFETYREALLEIDREPPEAALPRDPAYLSWALAALAPLTIGQRQALLEAEDAATRLYMVTEVLRTELRAMSVLPSLPATEIARTRWSPN